MMMIRQGFDHDNQTVHVSTWSPFDDPMTGVHSPIPASGVASGDGALDDEILAALQLCLGRIEQPEEDAAAPLVDACASDEFRMYEFKVRACSRGRNHDWTECPFAHPGEKARRRDPRAHRYSGVPCPAFRKAGGCKRGDACEFAHGVFECWLHPDRYRTQPCKDGTACRRRVCFFAHTPDQLRVVPQQKQSSAGITVGTYDGCPLRQQSTTSQPYLPKNLVTSPTSILISSPKSPPSESPPISPDGEELRWASWQAGPPVNDIVASLRQLQLSRAKSMASSYGRLQMGSSEFALPRGALSGFNAGFCSLPSTPTAAATGWLKDAAAAAAEERVESGRALRAKMFERLSKDSVFEKAKAEPDVEWVSDLIK